MAAYSRYWRRSLSRHPATELALSLRALRKVAAHLGRNVKPVFWTGMQATETNSITLDPDVADRGCPIPSETFDILVGQVVYEGLASIEWSEWVIEKVRGQAPDLSEKYAPFLDAFVQAAEDVYIDEFAKPKVWSLYLSKFWDVDRLREARDPALPPSASSLALIWRTWEVSGSVPVPLHHYYNDPLERLRECARAVREVADLSSPAERREKRVGLYLQAWPSIQKILAEWEEFATAPEAVNLFDEAAPQGPLPDPGERDEPESDDGRQEAEDAAGLDPDLAEEVENLLEDHETDLTRAILAAVEDPEAASMRTRIRQGTARMAVEPDPLLVKQLKRIFSEQESLARRERRRRTRRCLIEGSLDARRLYRVPIDGKVFKSREPPRLATTWQICLVADASASMAGKGVRLKPWPIAEKAFASLAEASRDSRNRVDIYAYHEEKGLCTLTRLYHGGKLYTVVPSGRTPSGQAIMAAAVTLRQSPGQSLIIHITDGASNCGVRLSDAVEFCSRNGIELVTIGCGCSRQTRDFLRECFPSERLYFMKHIRTLPLVLERLLRQRILFAPR